MLLHHAFRNGLIPLITLLGLSLRFLIGGRGAYRGRVRVAGDRPSLRGRGRRAGLSVAAGINLVIALAVILGNVLTDLLYSLADPRIVWQ